MSLAIDCRIALLLVFLASHLVRKLFFFFWLSQSYSVDSSVRGVHVKSGVGRVCVDVLLKGSTCQSFVVQQS